MYPHTCIYESNFVGYSSEVQNFGKAVKPLVDVIEKLLVVFE